MSVASWFKGVLAWLSCEAPASPVKAEAPKPEPTAPAEPPPPSSRAYREAPPPTPELHLMWNIDEGEGGHSKEVVERIKAKTRRRATRYFTGKEVRHRVLERKPDSIRFAFFRRSGKPLRIRWTNKHIMETP